MQSISEKVNNFLIWYNWLYYKQNNVFIYGYHVKEIWTKWSEKRKKSRKKGSVPGANTRDSTPNKDIREKTWQARQIRFSGVSKRPAHEIPPMTRSRGESLTGKADQVFRDFEKLPPALTLKMISVFLMPASMDSDTGRKAFPISSQIRINLEL